MKAREANTYKERKKKRKEGGREGETRITNKTTENGRKKKN